ncbi:MAG: hypothetical protein HQM10_12680 [Candidatus Riflebacteria bacterium]|nr:hypothetical protein [Candidatus Riflebacteria bacterium]
MNQQWGRFTAKGGKDLEERISLIISDVVDSLKKEFSDDEYRSIILIGGYGKGEGGSEIISGIEHPHNNLDFLLISRDPRPTKVESLRQRLKTVTDSLSSKHEIGMDSGAVSTFALSVAPCLVMWYDMRFGHKTILGDPDYVPSLKHFSVERVEPSDVRNLLVNRGTLLVINDLLLESKLRNNTFSPADQRTVVKHVMKAIIGYGDAFLFFSGNFHWSYIEKQHRIKNLNGLSEEFKRLYHKAAEFRFRPDYSAFSELDLQDWQKQLKTILEPIHLYCERMRLGLADLSWSEYPEKAFSSLFFENLTNLRKSAKMIMNYFRGMPKFHWKSKRSRAGWITAGIDSTLPIIFPVVAYNLSEQNFKKLVQTALDTSDSNLSELQKCYLKAWGKYKDINSLRFLESIGIMSGCENK